MRAEEALSLLGFLPQSHPTPSQVKEAYKRRAWETHPDRFPPHEKSNAEGSFKLISEAYSYLQSGLRPEASTTGKYYSRVVKTGVPRAQGGKKYPVFIGLPFILIVLGTVALGGSNAARAYRRQKEAHPSHNPFLP